MVTCTRAERSGKRPTAFPEDRDVVFTNYGITAFELLLRNESLSGATVVLPAFICGRTFGEVFDRYDLEPAFVDIDRSTYHLDMDRAREAAESADVLLLVHAFGAPADGDAWAELCRDTDVLLVEDCARALGAAVSGRPVGSFGRYAIYSLRKVVSLMRGGALIGSVSDPDLARFSFDPKDLYPFVPDRLADTARTTAESVIREENLERNYTRREYLDPINRTRFEYYVRTGFRRTVRRNRQMATFLHDTFDDSIVEPQAVSGGSAYHYFAATVPAGRDELVSELHDAGVPVETLWEHPWSESFVEGDLERAYPNTSHVVEHGLQLRLYEMSWEDVQRAASIVEAAG